MVEKNITFGKQTFVGRMNGDLEDKYDILEEIGIGGYSRVLKIENIGKSHFEMLKFSKLLNN